MSPKDAAKYMVGKKKIMILTGAGLSASSGIPTFRGSDGFWKKQIGKFTNPQELLTWRTWNDDPTPVW